MINTKTNEFIQQLLRLVESAELPVCNIRLALSCVMSQVADVERVAISQEQQQANSVDANEKINKE